MKIPKKESIAGNWAKAGEHIKDGDRIKIMDAGRIVEGDYGARKVFKILTLKREELNLSFNQTSLNNLVEGFGDESESWSGKVVKAFIIRQMVGDGLKNVIYLAPEGWTMDDDGHFVNPNEQETAPGVEYPKDEINPADIPF